MADFNEELEKFKKLYAKTHDLISDEKAKEILEKCGVKNPSPELIEVTKRQVDRKVTKLINQKIAEYYLRTIRSY